MKARRSIRRQSGFTLIELVVGITLMAAIMAGMLTAMSNALLTLQRTTDRLEQNRRAMGALSLIRRQVSALIPIRGMCMGASGLIDIFRGDGATLLLVSSESITEGSRGYPRIARYQFRPNRDGTVRLEVIEQAFAGPYSTAAFCRAGQAGLVAQDGMPAPLILYDRLAGGHFFYRMVDPYTRTPLAWIDTWGLPYLPDAIRIDIQPVPGSAARLPLGSVTIPVRISRDPGGQYKDELPLPLDDN